MTLLSTTVLTKYPSTDGQTSKGFVGWHQDLKYCGLVPKIANQRVNMVTMWLAIDEVGFYSSIYHASCFF